MISLRTLSILGISLLILLILWLFFWGEDFNSPESQIFAQYARGNYQEAAALLEKKQHLLDPAQYALFSAYINRLQNIQKSNEDLKKAAVVAGLEKSKDKNLLFEIYLNQALNEFLMGSPASMEVALKKAESVEGAADDWILFFKGLLDYLKGNYGTALSVLSEHKPQSRVSPWMQTTYQQIFTPDWYFVHFTKANIDQGNLFDVRQKLDEESKNASPQRKEQINLLLGLSYLKEASGKPFGTALPYFKLAFSFFDKASIQDESLQDIREEVIKKIITQITALIQAGQFDDMSAYAENLKKWDLSKKYYPAIEKLLIDNLNAQFSKGNWNTIQQIAASLTILLTDKEQGNLLEKKFENSAQEALIAGNMENVQHNLNIALLFAQNPDALKTKFSNQLATDIFAFAQADDSNLSLITPYVQLWNQLVTDPSLKMAMATKMLDFAKIFWDENQTDKALNFYLLGFSIIPEDKKKAFRDLLVERLKHSYTNALATNNRKVLKPLIQAKQQLQLTDLEFHEKEDAQKQAEEARQLFEQNQLNEALQKAMWTLEIDPNDQEALLLAGLINYEEGNYEQALVFLKQVKSLNEPGEKALAVSEIIAGDQEHGLNLLNQLKIESTDIDLRLGFGLLERNKPEQSLQWFKKIEHPNDEVLVGMAYASYQLKRWQDVLNDFSRLSEPYRDLVGIRGIAVNSMAQLNQIDKGEKLLNEILINPNQVTLPSPSRPFQSFVKNILGSQTPDLIAGIFYKNVQHDNGKALSYLKKASQNPLALAEIGEIYFDQKNWEQAIRYFNKSLEESLKTIQGETIKEKVSLKLGESYYRLGDDVRGASAFSAYFKNAPKETNFRSDYAQVLINLRLFTDACEQLKVLEKGNLLSTADKLNDLTCLVHTNQFDSARDKASQWIHQDPPLSLNDQLKILEIIIPLNDSELMKTVLSKADDTQKLTLEEKKSLLSFWIAIAHYDKATELAKSIESELTKSFDGLFLLAKLSAALSEDNKAKQYGEKALHLDPNNPKIMELIQLADLDIKEIQDEISKIKAKAKENQDSFKLPLELTKAYIAIALKEHKLDPSKSLEDITTLRNAYSQLEILARMQPYIPEVNFLLGKTAYLLNIKPIAMDSLKKALNYDGSYAEAYLYMARLLLDQGKTNEGIQNIQASLHYSPLDAESWFLLGLIYRKMDDSLDALNALEKVTQYKPNDPQAYIALGGLRLEIRNPEGAKQALEKALKLAPNNKEALQLLLVTLYDPFLRLDGIKPSELKKEQNEIYDRFHQLDPQTAEKLFNQLKEATKINN